MVLVEEYLEGEEVSLLALVSGGRSCRLLPRRTTSGHWTAMRAPTRAAWAPIRPCPQWTTGCTRVWWTTSCARR